MRKRIGLLSLIFIVYFSISGCSTSSNSFIGSSIEKSFPVPKQAAEEPRTKGRDDLRYTRYNLHTFKVDEGIPKEYLAAIEKWGWKIGKEDSSKMLWIFQKENKQINFKLNSGFFTIVLQENPRNDP